MNKNKLAPLASVVGLTVATALTAGVAQADVNPFSVNEISSGYEVAANMEGKCGEGKCGEGKCGGDTSKKADEAKKCDASKKADKEGKCGEGKCGGDASKKADKEGKCGEGKCGGSK